MPGMQLKDYLANNSSVNTLASELGVTPAAVRLWLSGERMPSPKRMVRIAEVTNGKVTYRDFYEAA